MYSVWVPMIAFLIIVILSVIWRAYLSAYVKQQKKEKSAAPEESMHGVMSRLRPVVVTSCIYTMCSVLLGNSDEKVSDALKYVKPAMCLDYILEKQNGQTRV